MPIDTKIGRPNQESEALAKAKGKNKASYANTFFGTVDDMFYEFGVLGRRIPQNKTDKKEGE